jgi:hypothetical protein
MSDRIVFDIDDTAIQPTASTTSCSSTLMRAVIASSRSIFSRPNKQIITTGDPKFPVNALAERRGNSVQRADFAPERAFVGGPTDAAYSPRLSESLFARPVV